MKVLLLSRAGSPHARDARALAGELAQAGHAARELALEADPALAAAQTREAFALAKVSDVVHVLGEPAALACALAVDAPVVVDLPAASERAGRELALRLAPRAVTAERGSLAGLAGRLEAYRRARAAHRAIDEHDSRPWGDYWVLVDDPSYKLKRIDVWAHKRLSYQKHAHRAEHWIVVRGRARVTLDGREIELERGGTVDIPLGAAHRMENPGDEILTFVELQSGSYFGEDDIVRLDDDFGRA